jgi:hypothetical protein
MIGNAAFLAALTLFLAVGWLAGEVSFLAAFRAALFHVHGARLIVVACVLFFNLTAAYYGLARWLFLRDTGRKLRHLDHQLASSDAVVEDLGHDLTI